MNIESIKLHIENEDPEDTVECILHLVNGDVIKVNYTEGGIVDNNDVDVIVYVGNSLLTIPPEVILYIESVDKSNGRKAIKW